MVRYKNNPPKLNDNVPAFLVKRINYNAYIESLIDWARKEYYDFTVELYAYDLNKARMFEQNCTFVDLVAHTKGFEKIINNMTDSLWNSLDRKTRRILTDARALLG